jgi:hypothetical protein
MSYRVNDVHVHTDKEYREALQWQRVEALAMAYRWLRSAASEDEAGEMVVECLKPLAEDPGVLEKVIAEARRWDESEKVSELHDREM